VASLFLKSSETNAHPINIASANDLRRHLAEIDIADSDIEGISGKFLYCTVKLESVDTRAANLMKTFLENFGGGLAMRKEAHEYTVRETDVIISGSRHTLQLLATRLKGEPFGLDAISGEIAGCLSAGNKVVSWGDRTLDFTRKTYVMGILNCTPDSFYPGSRSATIKEALKSAREMIGAGVDIIDVGGESSRPGADPVPQEEEIRRVIPVV
jgi:dihydropteroate synthase